MQECEGVVEEVEVIKPWAKDECYNDTTWWLGMAKRSLLQQTIDILKLFVVLNG